MYNNIGDKLRFVAKFCGYFGIFVSVIGVLCIFIALFGEEWLFAAAPVVIAWGSSNLFASYLLYAFGQITDDIHAMRLGTAAPTGQNAAAIDDDLPEL